MLKAILFDLGDTLFDSRPLDTREAFDRAAQHSYKYLQTLGFPLPTFEEYHGAQYAGVRRVYLWSRLCGRECDSFNVLRKVCAKYKFPLDEVGLRELGWQWYLPLVEFASVAADVVPVLTKLRERGLKMAIVSNTLFPGFVLDRHLAMHGLLEFFPVRIYSSDIGYRKPHRRIFEAAMDGLGVTAKESVFIGDLVRVDIVGAQRLGLTAVLRQPAAPSRTHRVADHVIRNLTDLYQILPLLGAPSDYEWMQSQGIQPSMCAGGQAV